MADRSNGYDDAAAAYLPARGRRGIGAGTVRAWAGLLPPGAAVLDLGCGDGVPVSRTLVEAGLTVSAVDASPAMVAAYQVNYPRLPVACEPAEHCTFFGRTFAGVVAWGLLFLLPPESQKAVIKSVAAALEPGGRFLFTAPAQACTWDDLTTGRPSASLGSDGYRAACRAAGLAVAAEYTDEGDNHYYDAVRV